ncbi:MAG TPA: hypothetical protein VLX09_01305 [Stellaceae bacterium]|nr:hypothetical protein [Stellaceae bacterium]
MHLVAVAADAVPSDTAEADCAPVARDVPAIDLVALTVLAVNRLAPATLRSATYGKALKVVVSDELVGAIFRAALEQMGLHRSTDRLIEIVVKEERSGSEGTRSA